MKERCKDLSDTLFLITYFSFRLHLGINFLDFEVYVQYYEVLFLSETIKPFSHLHNKPSFLNIFLISGHKQYSDRLMAFYLSYLSYALSLLKFYVYLLARCSVI